MKERLLESMGWRTQPAIDAIGSFSIAAGQSATVRLRFVPAGVGAQSATLTITSNDPVNPVVKVNLTGNGLAAASLPPGQSFQQIATLPLPGTGQPI